MGQGPKAPKDPTKKRPGFYVMLDSDIEATKRLEGKPSQEIYLDDGRLVDKAKVMGGITDETMLDMLKDAAGFRKLVHSIGVSVTADNAGEVDFALHIYGKTNKYGGGTYFSAPVPTNGSEVIFEMAELAWSDDDDKPGQFKFLFDEAGKGASASIKLYLNDGYTAPDVEVDAPVPFGTDAYKKTIAKSLLNQGNNFRLKSAIEKAKKGEEVTVAYIGGSITQGAGAKPIHTECYAYQSFCLFKEMFAGKDAENVQFIKAGVGGTPSELGMIRFDRDVLRDGKVIPDVVIVEFAVNDEGDETEGESFESLVTKILTLPNKPAVILLFSVFSNDWNLQDRLAPIGKHYDLPMVSVLDAVSSQFGLTVENGRVISKRQFFYDSYHPTNKGHKVMADCLAHLYQETDEAEQSKEDICENIKPLLANDFTEIHLLDRKDNMDKAEIDCGGFTETDKQLQVVEMDANPDGTPEFPYNWMRTPDSGKGNFKIKIKSQSLVLVFKDSAEVNVGKADVFVDGKKVMTLDPHINGWTHCNPVIVYRKSKNFPDKETFLKDVHEVEIRMADGDEDKYFTILGFGFVE